MKKQALAEPAHLAADLKELKLPSVMTHWERLAEEAHRKRQSHPEYLADLMHAEVNDRRERRIARLIRDAHFPVLKTLDGFDFAAQASVERDAVLDLAHTRFVAEHRNVVLMGEVGTGKTHLAIALGLAACQREHRVRFATAAERPAKGGREMRRAGVMRSRRRASLGKFSWNRAGRSDGGGM